MFFFLFMSWRKYSLSFIIYRSVSLFSQTLWELSCLNTECNFHKLAGRKQRGKNGQWKRMTHNPWRCLSLLGGTHAAVQLSLLSSLFFFLHVFSVQASNSSTWDWNIGLLTDWKSEYRSRAQKVVYSSIFFRNLRQFMKQQAVIYNSKKFRFEINQNILVCGLENLHEDKIFLWTSFANWTLNTVIRMQTGAYLCPIVKRFSGIGTENVINSIHNGYCINMAQF